MKRELTDDPCQTSFDGTDALVQIMPVQTHTRLEAQTVTRAETDELHDAAGRVDELLGDALCSFSGYRYLIDSATFHRLRVV